MMSLGLWLFGPTSLQLLGLGYESSILQDFQLPQPPWASPWLSAGESSEFPIPAAPPSTPNFLPALQQCYLDLWVTLGVPADFPE